MVPLTEKAEEVRVLKESAIVLEAEMARLLCEKEEERGALVEEKALIQNEHNRWIDGLME